MSVSECAHVRGGLRARARVSVSVYVYNKLFTHAYNKLFCKYFYNIFWQIGNKYDEM